MILFSIPFGQPTFLKSTIIILLFQMKFSQVQKLLEFSI